MGPRIEDLASRVELNVPELDEASVEYIGRKKTTIMQRTRRKDYGIDASAAGRF